MLEKLLKIAEKNDWSVSYDKKDNYIALSKISPEGQDFSFYISYREDEDREDGDLLLNKMQDYYENYDTSYETYIWLDSEGHGQNGAPYDMLDVYNDMAWCRDEVEALHDVLSEYINEIED